MATISVAVCPGGAQQIVSSGGVDVAGCTTGQLAYQQVTVSEPFDPATIDTATAGAALGAGFVVMATGIVIMMPVRILVKFIRGDGND